MLPISLLATSILLFSAAPSAPVAFVHFLGDQPFAEETVETTEDAGSATVHGHVSATLPNGASMKLDYVSKLSKDRSRVVDYTAELHVMGKNLSFGARPTETGWRMEKKEGEAEPTVVEKEVAGPSLVLDNNLAWPIDLFVRGLRIDPGQTATYSAVVPQVQLVVPLKATRLPDTTAKVDGHEIAARRYRLEAATVVLEITARATDGALLEASIPLQKAAYRARGFEPPAAPDAKDARESQIAVPSPAGDLPAVLTRPRGDAPAPAVVLLSGSGPNDRDETFGPNKPLRDLARGLADNGVASLRFDKRTVKTGDPALIATLKDEYVTDALKAIELLASSPGIDASRIFVVGHSLGAAMAPIVAKQSERVRGVVLLAAPFRRADVMILDQMRFQLEIAGTEKTSLEAQIGQVSGTLQAIRTGSAEAPASYMGAPSPYWRELFALDLARSLRELGLPALVVQGEKDIQVRVDTDFEALRGSLGEDGGRITYMRLPGLNHLLMKVDGQSTGAEYSIEGKVEPAVTAAVAAWIAKGKAPEKERPAGR